MPKFEVSIVSQVIEASGPKQAVRKAINEALFQQRFRVEQLFGQPGHGRDIKLQQVGVEQLSICFVELE